MAFNSFVQWCLVALLLCAVELGFTGADDPPCQVQDKRLICRTEPAGDGWIVFQQRFDGSVDFNRDWDDYRRGFGEVAADKEFWWGLKRVKKLTKTGNYELLIEMQDEQGEYRYARYSEFVVGGENDGWNLYRLDKLGGYSGTAGDTTQSLGYENPAGHWFSTRDSDNDGSIGNCADFYGGGWWYNQCGAGPNSKWKEHTIWNAWKREPLVYFRMSIRAK